MPLACSVRLFAALALGRPQPKPQYQIYTLRYATIPNFRWLDWWPAPP